MIACIAPCQSQEQRQPEPVPIKVYSYIPHGRKATPPKEEISAIERAIIADPQNSDHYFNLAIVYAFLLCPKDIITARAAYAHAIALGAGRDDQLEGALK